MVQKRGVAGRIGYGSILQLIDFNQLNVVFLSLILLSFIYPFIYSYPSLWISHPQACREHKEFASNDAHKILKRGALPPCDPPGYLSRNDGHTKNPAGSRKRRLSRAVNTNSLGNTPTEKLKDGLARGWKVNGPCPAQRPAGDHRKAKRRRKQDRGGGLPEKPKTHLRRHFCP